MALPPDALDEVLPDAAVIVDAEVASVRDVGAWPVDAGAALDGAMPRPAQEVTLRVRRVLRGTPTQTLVVTKEANAYALHAGVHGTFLLDAHALILGRYGPDTWAIGEVENALAGSAR